MAELRWNPMTKDWVMVISNRAKRPNMPKDYCPFCPGSGKVPDNYQVYKYDNDFPALSRPPAEMNHPLSGNTQGPYKVAPAYGKCEVILFSPDHHGKLYELAPDHMRKLVDLWQQRFVELSADDKIKYVFIFENRGEAVGVTQPHPHGQIYGYPFLPKKIEIELANAVEYFDERSRCLFCDMNREEETFKQRVVCENEDFIAYIPFFSEYAYGVYISAKQHIGNIGQFTPRQKEHFGEILRNVTGAYDHLFDTVFPYMMCMHNAPVDAQQYADVEKAYHFHVEMLTPMRSATVQQFRASSESGVWASCNPSSPEENAAQLRAALGRFLETLGR